MKKTEKTVVHLVRHGEVENPQGVFYGRIPGYFLSKNGEEQAHTLGKHLSSRPVAAIYASPLDRTKQTAQIVASYLSNIPITHDERLIEVGSPLQGQLMKDLADTFYNFYTDPYIAQGGETMEGIVARMQSFFDEIVPRHTGEEIIVVSHGDPIMLMRAVATKNPVAIESIRGDYYVDTAHGVQLTFEGITIVATEDIIVRKK
jgi:broad specificity phosphatase PhoE